MSAVWDRTTEFLSDNIGAVAAIAGLTLFVPNVVSGILEPLKATAGQDGRVALGFMGLVFSLVGLLGQGALVALALEPALGRGGALARGLQRLGPMIGVSALLLFGLIVLCLPPVFLFALDGIDVTAMEEGVAPNLSPGNALLILLYLLLLLPGLFWLGARLMPVTGVIVAERRGVGAIRRGFALSRGLALKLVGVTILFLIVATVAILATRTVIGSVARLSLGDEGPITAASVVTAIAVALVYTMISTIGFAFLARLYAACIARAEASPAA